jgi:hypothetical protein
MSSPNDNTSPHARAFYDNQVARRRQLSSGPLGRNKNIYRYLVGGSNGILQLDIQAPASTRHQHLYCAISS